MSAKRNRSASDASTTSGDASAQDVAINESPRRITRQLDELPRKMAEALTQMLQAAGTTNKPPTDPLLLAVIERSGLEATTFDSMTWTSIRTLKEPWCWVLLLDVAHTSMNHIINSFQLPGELTQRVKLLLQRSYHCLLSGPDSHLQLAAIEAIIEDFICIGTIVNSWTGTPIALTQSIAPHILRTQKAIDVLDSKVFGKIRGPRAETIYRENVQDLRPTNFPKRACEALKYASYIKKGGDGNDRRDDHAPHRGTCDRCKKTVKKGEWKEHNKSCKAQLSA